MEERIRSIAESHSLRYNRCLQVAIETRLYVGKVARGWPAGVGCCVFFRVRIEGRSGGCEVRALAFPYRENAHGVQSRHLLDHVQLYFHAIRNREELGGPELLLYGTQDIRVSARLGGLRKYRAMKWPAVTSESRDKAEKCA